MFAILFYTESNNNKSNLIVNLNLKIKNNKMSLTFCYIELDFNH